MPKKRFGEQPRTLNELDRFNHELLPQICDKITGAKYEAEQGRNRYAHHALDSCTKDCNTARNLELERIHSEGRTPGEGLPP